MSGKALLIFGFLFSAVNCIIQSPPKIVKQPPTEELLFQVASQLNENDKPFFIECEAEGEPIPKYRWIKNGKHFDWPAYDNRMSQQSGRGTLVISSPRDEDLGQYQCFAENEWGTATSNSVFVRKAELNSFKDTPPTILSANEGDPFKLTCQPPDGWPKPNVYWLTQDIDGGIKSINNSRMTLDPEGNLWFSNVTRQDASTDFHYACAATSLFRNEYKVGNKIFVNVVSAGVQAASNKYEPVQQYVTRKNEVALRGKKVELFCIYGGTPLPQIVWSKDGTIIQPSDRLTQGNYGKSLIIKHANFEDQGKYTCEASNGVGQAKSYSVSLTVLAVPYFTVEPEFVNAAEGETVEFRCEAYGVPEPQIKWIHNGKPIGSAPPNSRRSVGANVIRIRDLVKQDTGNYGCNATNSLGYVYKDVYVNVLALAPEITEPPRREQTVDGRTVKMTCRVFGAPKPEVKWVRSGRELTGGRYAVEPSGDLRINSAQFSDAGEYTCYASNKFGEANASGALEVKESTKIIDEPIDYEVAAGSQATFRCNAVADQSLNLEIDWLSKGQPIDLESEPRFIKSSDYSLTITKTTELDSGEYTCIARTELDEVTAKANLVVQDIPNAPRLESVDCRNKDATIRWLPMGDNRSPILYFVIQYNTSFAPDTWEVAYENVPAADTSFNVPMSPWANYTFRVLAINKIGPSLPSGHSSVCTTQPDVPYENPSDVEGKGTEPDNLVISWTVMPEIDHNAPRFHYRVSWKRDIPGEEWNIEEVSDWRQAQIVIRNQPTYERYKIKVVAINEKGEANVAAREFVGHSGENVPTQAPTNFTLLRIHAGKSALLSWNPVPFESVRGNFKGYKIEIWTDEDKNHREVHVKGDASKALVTKFVPHTKNYARVYVFNERYNGPPSETLVFVTPEAPPGPVKSLEAIPLGSSAFYLTWMKPTHPNGDLTGYNVFYQAVNGMQVEALIARVPNIQDPNQTYCKLSGLKADTKYRLQVRALNSAGEGDGYFIEQATRGHTVAAPDVPYFDWYRVPTDTNNLVSIMVVWRPNPASKFPGSHFFVKYKPKGDTVYLTSDREFNENFVQIRGLDPNTVYEFKVVAVDGELWTESEPQYIDTSGMADGPVIQPKENVATAGWFIGMMLAIAFLLLVLIAVCIVMRNRGGKYAVHEREQANGRHDYPDEGGFHEYSQPLDGKSHGRASMSSDPKLGPESDTDSMAEYGEGDTEGMNEDGSFIGQYGRQKKGGETTSQGYATLV